MSATSQSRGLRLLPGDVGSCGRVARLLDQRQGLRFGARECRQGGDGLQGERIQAHGLQRHVLRGEHLLARGVQQRGLEPQAGRCLGQHQGDFAGLGLAWREAHVPLHLAGLRLRWHGRGVFVGHAIGDVDAQADIQGRRC